MGQRKRREVMRERERGDGEKRVHARELYFQTFIH